MKWRPPHKLPRGSNSGQTHTVRPETMANHLFKVAADGLTVEADDRGDGGYEQIWMELVLPE